MHRLVLLFSLLLLSTVHADKAYTLALSSPADKAILEVLSSHISIKENTNHDSHAIELLQNYKIDFAIVNSNTAFEAFKKDDSLRAIGALYPKMLTLITTKESPIDTLKVFKTKTLKFDIVGEDTRDTAHQILEKCEITQLAPLKTFEVASQRLLAGETSGFFTLEGHPNRRTQDLDKSGKIKFVPLYGKKFDQLNSDFPYFHKGGIPKGVYSLEKDIKSIGTKALLITREDMEEATVKKITRIILKNIDTIKEKDFIYRGLSPKHLLEGVSIPFHKGATKAFNKM